MNLQLLRTFITVSETMHFTRAAELLNISQPTVSRQIRQLEEELSVQLFEQIGKSLHLTPAGQAFATESRKVLGAMDRAIERAKGYCQGIQGLLRIGASTTPGFYLLPAILGRFHKNHPKVRLELQVENSQSVEEALLQNRIDLGFVGQRLSNTVFEQEPITVDEIICVVGSNHPLSQSSSNPIQPSDLSAETWLTREPGSATGRHFEKWCLDQAVDCQHCLQLSCPEALKRLAIQNIGIAVTTRLAVLSELSLGQLCEISLPGFPIERPIVMFRHLDKADNPVLNAFTQLIKDYGDLRAKQEPAD